MNTFHLQELAPADRAFAEAAALGLRASESLNYVESARLAATRARVRALVAGEEKSSLSWRWLLAPAAVAAMAVLLVRQQSAAPVPVPVPVEHPGADVLIELSSDVNAVSPDALMWVSDEAGPDFYRDLKFYQWLQSRSPTEPNA